MDMQPVEAVAAEGRDQRGMHVDDAVLVALNQRFIEDNHESCEDDQVCLLLLQNLDECLGIGLVVRVVLPRDNPSGNPRIFGAFQRESVRVGGDHTGDLTALDGAGFLRIDERL